MVPFSTRRVINSIRDGKVPRQVLNIKGKRVSIAYHAATYLGDAPSSNTLESLVGRTQGAGIVSEMPTQMAYEIVFLQPGRVSLQMLLQTCEGDTQQAPILLMPPSRDWPVTKESLLAEFERRLGKGVPLGSEGINAITPFLLTERISEGGSLILAQRVLSLAIGLTPSGGNELRGTTQGGEILSWMTSPRFDAEILKRSHAISDHTRIVAGLVWDRNYPLTMSPPFDDLSGEGVRADTAALSSDT